MKKPDEDTIIGYEQQMREAQKAGTVEQMTYPFYIWEEKEQTLIGRLVKFEELDSDKFEGKFIRYIFDTDEGEVAVICGAVVDKVLHNDEAINGIYAITFQGQQEGKSGQKFNMFDVERMVVSDVEPF